MLKNEGTSLVFFCLNQVGIYKFIFVIASLGLCPNLWANSASDFGTVGLIDMPTARMKADGTFSATISRQDSTDIYNLSYQAFPWLETTFRYSIFDPREDFETSNLNLRDRSYGAKILLFGEKKYRPAVAVGLRDVLGTGVFGSEYVVASKNWQQFDASLGIGWGRLSGNDAFRNPLITISDSFENRDASVGLGGEFSFNNFFSGERVGIFGGISYDIPKYNLRLMTEYNSDDYTREVSTGVLDLDSRFSYGVNWKPIPTVELGLSWQHGSELGLRISSSLPSKNEPGFKRPELKWKDVHTKSDWGEYSSSEVIVEYDNLDSRQTRVQLSDKWFRQLYKRFKALKLTLAAVKLIGQGHLALEYYNPGYTYQIDAVKVIYEQLIVDLPLEINQITLINIDNGIRSFSTTIPLNRNFPNKISTNNIAFNYTDKLDAPDQSYPFRNPFVKWSGDFGIRNSLFAPEAPFRTQLNFKIRAKVSFSKSASLNASYVIDIANNFDNSMRRSDSVLPRVRSDINLFLEEGASGINTLYFVKYGQVSPNTVYRAYAGILEEMFTGVGGEILYRPDRSRFAYGLNLNYVFLRDFEKNFALQDYEVFTGHASIYWASPFDNYDVAVHIGRYLAGDFGATFEVSRSFANGWEVGVFATFTDVPFEDFGEGSFDKGLRIRIPLNIFGGNTKRTRGTTIRSIQRDGGARLNGHGTTLWRQLRSTHYDRISTTLDRFNRN